MIFSSFLSFRPIGVEINFLTFILLGLTLPALSAEISFENHVRGADEAIEILPISPSSDFLKTANAPENPPIPASSASPGTDISISQFSGTAQEGVNVPDGIVVKKFVFVNCTDKGCAPKEFTFRYEELEKVIKTALRIENFPAKLTFVQLLQARSAITQHYLNKGYITSGAYIPEQDFRKSEGLIQIAIVEGTTTLDLKGPGDSGLECLKSQLDSTKPFNQNEFLNNLRLLQESDPRIEKLEAELGKGTEIGRNPLKVTVYTKELASPSWNEFLEKPFKFINLKLFADNNQSPSIGSVSQNLQISIDPFLDVNFARTEGGNSFDLSLLLPGLEDEKCRSFGGNIRFGVKKSKIISQPFNELDIESSSLYLDAILMRQEKIKSPGTKFQWGGIVSYRESSTSLLKIPFPISPGANRDGETSIFALRPYMEWTERNRFDALALRGELSLGGSFSWAGDDSFLRPFVLLRGQTQWARLLTPDIALAVNTNLQIAGSTLPALEQISLGGQDTIRGYRKNLLLADNGLFTSAELQFTIAKAKAWRIKLIPFMDFGTGWNHPRNFDIPITNTLWSTGIGVLIQNDDKFNARIDWGIPLIKVNANGDSLQDQGIYFSISIKKNFK